MRILIVIPTYNCEKQISKVLQGFNKKLINRVTKVVIIDNGSSDNTLSVALKAINRIRSPKFEIWQNIKNYNLGGTHKVAFIAAEKLNMDYIAILHGDNQANTTELNDLIDVAESDKNYDAILGSRFMKGSRLIGYDKTRIIGNRVLNIIFSIIALRVCRDLGSGINLFKTRDLKDQHYLGFEDSITFNIDLLLDYYRKKTKLKFVPITWSQDDQVSNAQNIKVATTAIVKLLLWRVNKSKFKLHKPSDYKSKIVTNL